MGDPLTEAKAQHILDQLPGEATTKRMFGCVAFMRNSRMFAILDRSGTLYVKVDDTTREDFISSGGQPFTYVARNKHGEAKTVEMSYYTVPDEVFDADEELARWLLIGISATAYSPKVGQPNIKAELTKLGLI